MAKDKLIAIGCSYTEHYLDSMHTTTRLDFNRWPQRLAEKFDMECINLGKSGSGQEYMLSKLLDVMLFQKNIGLVVIMWSEFHRMDFQPIPEKISLRDRFPYGGWTALHPHRNNSETEKHFINRESRISLLEYNNTISAAMRSLRFFLIAQKLLKDTPYFMVQGTEPLSAPMFLFREAGGGEESWSSWDKKRRRAIKQFIESPITNEVKEQNFIGWPVFKEIGGYCIDNFLDSIDPERTKLRVDAYDSHPNGAGHQHIAEMIYDKYEEVYI